jgi:hypothetical protein
MSWTIPARHWRSYGSDPLPTGEQALDEPLNAFPSWFLPGRVRSLRPGADRQPAHMPRGDMPIRDIIARMRHDGCGGRTGKSELLTDIAGASSRPVRIVLRGPGRDPDASRNAESWL